MRKVVITGASRGLGLTTANYFVSQDWQVVAIGLSQRPKELNEQIDYHQFDLTDQKAAQKFWQQLSSDQSKQKITLINNAGGFSAGDLAEAQLDDFHKQMAINYFTGVTMTKGLVANFKKARIISIVSAAALSTSPHILAYGSAKAAAKHFYQSLSQELASSDYQITNIYPDMMATGGANTTGIDPTDVAELLLDQASQTKSYYVADISIRTSQE